MKKWANLLATACIVGLVVTSAGCIITTDGDSSFTIRNSSDYVIEYIYVSPSDSSSWGPDLLGGDVLYPGESLTVDYLDCDYYDVMVVDEFGVECILETEYLCFDDGYWRITNTTLGICAY